MNFAEAVIEMEKGKVCWPLNMGEFGLKCRISEGVLQFSMDCVDWVKSWHSFLDIIKMCKSEWKVYEPKEKKVFELHEAIVEYSCGDYELFWLSDNFDPVDKRAVINFTGKTKTVEVEV